MELSYESRATVTRIVTDNLTMKRTVSITTHRQFCPQLATGHTRWHTFKWFCGQKNAAFLWAAQSVFSCERHLNCSLEDAWLQPSDVLAVQRRAKGTGHRAQIPREDA